MTQSASKSDDTIRSATGVQVIARASDVLRALSSAPGGLTQAELTQRIGLARSTAYRILSALEEEGLVTVSQSGGRYRLGQELMRLAQVARREAVHRVRPYLQILSDTLNETVDFSILDSGRVTFLEQVIAPQRLRAAIAVGESFPLHTCAPGKAILASLAPDELASALARRLVGTTPATITSPERLREELEDVRRLGFATDVEEHTLGVCALGAVIPGTSPRMALSVPMPSQRFDEQREVAARQVLDACAVLAREL